MFVVKIPGIDGLGKTNGCEKAGNAMLKALDEISVNEQGKEVGVKFLDLEEIHLDNSNLELTNKLIYENSREIFETKLKTIFLGGDHSISYSNVRAFLDYCLGIRKLPYLVVFDAHADCLNKKSRKFPGHREWIRSLIEAGFPSQNILIVGVRNLTSEENSFLKEKKIKFIPMNHILESIQDIGDIVTEFSRGNELYVSVDVDVIDSSFASGVSYPESGGLSSREFLYLIQRINKMKNLRAVDLVDINLNLDKTGTTVKLAAKILSELI